MGRQQHAAGRQSTGTAASLLGWNTQELPKHRGQERLLILPRLLGSGDRIWPTAEVVREGATRNTTSRYQISFTENYRRVVQKTNHMGDSKRLL